MTKIGNFGGFESKITKLGNSGFSYQSQEQADEIAKSLDKNNNIDCRACYGCYDCVNCTKCVGCYSCKNLSSQNNVYGVCQEELS